MNKIYLLLILISGSLSAQIKGVVKDSLTGNPIPYVNIWVENKNIGTTSEENGSFSIDLKKLNKLEDKLEKKAQRFNWNDEQQLSNN